MKNVTGGCYCGNIRYQFAVKPKLKVNCHCNNCRRAIGAQSVAWIIINNSTFQWTKGSPVRYKTETEAWRTFCSGCGSSLTYESPKRTDDIDITVGSLDSPEDFPPTDDAYLDSRLSWVAQVDQHG